MTQDTLSSVPDLSTELRLEGTDFGKNAIKRVNYSHDAMIDIIIASPSVTLRELATLFGMRESWISQVRNSDAFLARLAKKKALLVDPIIQASVEERVRAVADKSLEVVLEKLTVAPTFDQALAAASMATKAMGFGARQSQSPVQMNFVVALPGKVDNAQDWSQKHFPKAEVVDVEADSGSQSPAQE